VTVVFMLFTDILIPGVIHLATITLKIEIMSYKRFSDPYATIARFPSRCCVGNCQAKINKGDSIVYDKMRGKVYCRLCGEPIMQATRAAQSMDQFGTDIYG